jgi:hypothetical protein
MPNFIPNNGMGEVIKRRRAFLIKRIWSCDKCLTLRSCAGVVLIGAAVAGILLIIRLAGEKRLQRLLNFILFFKRREPKLDLISGALAPKNRI